ncbi:hypothetical protein [Patiriisocius sp. Uisw_017]|jgi:hypothetical protein|uniref:hypothetical protein n=1 Tax=Patiriisocius sp. Uisw_017 TaxID=3230968 RepID=UPI0039EC9EFD
MTLNKYFYLIAVILINSFATIQANNFQFNTEKGLSVYNFKIVQPSSETSFYNDIDTSSFSEATNHLDCALLFGFIEIVELENDEFSPKHKPQPTNAQEVAFKNSKLFKNSSKELEKNIRRPQRVVLKSTTKLHTQYQVFII